MEGLNSVHTADVNLVAEIADLGLYVSMIEINIDVENVKDQESVNMERINHTVKIVEVHRSVNIKKQKYHCKECKAIEIQRYLQMSIPKECNKTD